MGDEKSPKKPEDGYVNGFPKAGDGEWDRVGWAPQFGSLEDSLEVSKYANSDHQTWVESKLDEKWYGGECELAVDAVKMVF